MNKKLLKLLSIGMLTLQLTQSPLQAKLFNADTTMPDATLPMTLCTAAVLYTGYNYLIRQDFLVEKKYPSAFAWYQSMQAKYPGVLNGIYFIQTPAGSLIPDFLSNYAKQCSWTRHDNRIYFSKSDLSTISLIYTKVIDGYPLHEKEQLMLACYEFMLLHEAGHLVHKDSQSLIVSIAGLCGLVYGGQYAYNQIYPATPVAPAASTPSVSSAESQAEKNMLAGYELANLKDVIGEKSAAATTGLLELMGFPSKIPGILATAQGATFVAGIIALLRHQEYTADQFACTHADSQTLKQALAMFEDDETDILYELETKTVMPYIPATSAPEATVQSIAQIAEYTALYGAQQFYLLFKKSVPTRWFFDFTQNALHHGPSIRAQMIHEEIERRQAQD